MRAEHIRNRSADREGRRGAGYGFRAPAGRRGESSRRPPPAATARARASHETRHDKPSRKLALARRDLADAHPEGREASSVVHVAWLASTRTDPTSGPQTTFDSLQSPRRRRRDFDSAPLDWFTTELYVALARCVIHPIPLCQLRRQQLASLGGRARPVSVKALTSSRAVGLSSGSRLPICLRIGDMAFGVLRVKKPPLGLKDAQEA